ncbi:MAG TPA: methyltransferase domain-containing protein [Candidatus Limnocylindrales bacterium]|nr:methyltransferase domain-containing protein [Candidatus Limnocylindrales bacterium]
MNDVYTHGHHESVLRSHRSRTAENSCGYLLSSLRPGLDLLDVGCGPGTITRDLAARVAPGRVVGIDLVSVADLDDVPNNVEFAVGDAYDLEFADASFDVVHAHQVLQHLTRPVDALTEMRRVLRPGGLVAVRDSDYGAFRWSPPDPRLDRWLGLYHELTERNGVDADAGRHLEGWVRAAGFTDIVPSSSEWTFEAPEERAWWGSMWADRVLHSNFASQSLAYGLTTDTELTDIADAWREWADRGEGSFTVPHGEVLGRRSG